MSETTQDTSDQASNAQTPWEAPELVKVDVAASTLFGGFTNDDGGSFSS
jgi:hypothetical protein